MNSSNYTSNKKLNISHLRLKPICGINIRFKNYTAIENIMQKMCFNIFYFKRFFVFNALYFSYHIPNVNSKEPNINKCPLPKNIISQRKTHTYNSKDYLCSICGNIPFYDMEQSNNLKHCLCYILYKVVAKLMKITLKTTSDFEILHKKYITSICYIPNKESLSKNRTCTSFSTSKCIQNYFINEKYSVSGTFGNIRLCHSDKETGFGLLKNIYITKSNKKYQQDKEEEEEQQQQQQQQHYK